MAIQRWPYYDGAKQTKRREKLEVSKTPLLHRPFCEAKES